MTNGLQFQASYTLSRAQDNGQASQTFTPGFSLPFDPFNQAGENGLSNFDRRHKFVASVVYNTNFASLKDNKVGRAIFNGWTIAPVVNMFSGARYTGTLSGGSNVSFANTALFGASQAGGTVNGSNGSFRFAYLPPNFFKQPPIKYVDLRLSRRFAITEKAHLEVIAEGFNIFNRTQVTSLNSTIYNVQNNGTLTFEPTFGTIAGTSDGFFFRERQIQLAARFEF